jgi:serine/threonine-protein kinase
MLLTPGTRLGSYVITAKIGAGGMGEVYLAEDSGLKRRVAIKVLSASISGDAASRERLVAEAQAAAALDHPNVCAIYEVGEHDGHPYFAMQYVEGETLADRIARGPLALTDVLSITTQIADALANAHGCGMVHRDIKPQNIMLTPGGQLKVLDFGLAKRAPGNDSNTMLPLTAPGVVAGTTAYMSPEQLRGETVDPSTDLFSLGCVIQEMVNQRHPFARKSAVDTISAILSEEPPNLDGPSPPELARIVRKCLEKDRARRYRVASDLLADLRNLARPVYSSDTNVGTRRRWPMFAAVAGVAVAIMVTAGAIWTLRRHEPAGSGVRVLAILPFSAPDESSAYLGDGISESIINSLSRLPGIKVLGRATTFRYRGPGADPAALRRDLGVDAVVSGTVLQQGRTLVVQAELIDASDNTQLWGQRYNNRELTDVFEVQEHIARAIAASLSLELAGREAEFSKRDTGDVEAYRSYQLGRRFAQQRTPEDLATAVDHYRRAIARDDRYALAFAGLTDAYINMISRGVVAPQEGRRLAGEAADRAMMLDPALAESNAAFGQMRVYLAPFDFESGDRALRRAIDINPGWAIGHQYLAVSLLEQGRLAETVRALEIAHELDPLSGFITRFLAFARLLNGDSQGAMTLYRSAASQGPPFATNWDAEIFVAVGAVEEGLAGAGIRDHPFHRVIARGYAKLIDAELRARADEADALLGRPGE